MILLIFWSLVFISETILILKLNKEKWPTIVPRYVCSLFVLILGFLAPGIASNDNDEYLKDDKPEVKQETKFIWIDALKNIRLLLPFVWPRKNLDVQLRILFCVFLLIVERFINVIVPLYNQKIGEFTNSSY